MPDVFCRPDPGFFCLLFPHNIVSINLVECSLQRCATRCGTRLRRSISARQIRGYAGTGEAGKAVHTDRLRNAQICKLRRKKI